MDGERLDRMGKKLDELGKNFHEILGQVFDGLYSLLKLRMVEEIIKARAQLPTNEFVL